MFTKSSALSLFITASAFATVASSAEDSVTREIPWDGSTALTVAVPAHVKYVQAPGPGKVVVTGPRRSVEKFEVKGGVLNDRTLRTGTHLQITVTAPNVTYFSIKGGDRLIIEGFDQDELRIEATGRADVKASGRAGVLKLDLKGSGWADLSHVESRGAEIALTGSRKAIVAPTSWAKLSGNGVVILLTQPSDLQQEMWGAGRIIHAGRTAGEVVRRATALPDESHSPADPQHVPANLENSARDEIGHGSVADSPGHEQQIQT